VHYIIKAFDDNSKRLIGGVCFFGVLQSLRILFKHSTYQLLTVKAWSWFKFWQSLRTLTTRVRFDFRVLNNGKCGLVGMTSENI